MNIDKNYLRNFLHDDIIAMGFDEESVDMAIDAFVDSVEESMPLLLDSVTQENFENIRFYAHSLKGTFANFENEFFKELSTLFKNIEFTAKEKGDIAVIKNKLKEILDKTSSWLKV